MLEVFSRSEMMDLLDEFHDIYQQRPIADNHGGMKSPHMFPAWFTIRTLKPKYIIESGVWKGQGTWFFEHASPTSKIISIDPNPGLRLYTSPNVDYRTTDFTQQSWTDIEPSNTLVFLDDHQNSLQRIKFAVANGFKSMMVEDNYPCEQGDCYTPKKILTGEQYVIDKAGDRTWFFGQPEDKKYLHDVLAVYQEFPPIYKDDFTRWGDEWKEPTYVTPEPLLTDSTQYPLFYEERKDYTWICYLEL
jgi:hypothetical protein